MRFNRILGDAAFAPFEEQFDLPAAAIQLGNRMCGQARFNIPETFPAGELGAGHAQELVETGIARLITM